MWLKDTPLHPRLAEIRHVLKQHFRVLDLISSKLPIEPSHFTCDLTRNTMTVPSDYYDDECKTSELSSNNKIVVRSLQFSFRIEGGSVHFEPQFIRRSNEKCTMKHPNMFRSFVNRGLLTSDLRFSCSVSRTFMSAMYTVGALLNREVFQKYGPSYFTTKAREWCTEPIWERVWFPCLFGKGR